MQVQADNAFCPRFCSAVEVPCAFCCCACPSALPQVAATSDRFYLLPTPESSFRLPAPKALHNKGNYVVSLRWVADITFLLLASTCVHHQSKYAFDCCTSHFPPHSSPPPHTSPIHSEVRRWLSKQVEAAGVDILPHLHLVHLLLYLPLPSPPFPPPTPLLCTVRCVAGCPSRQRQQALTSCHTLLTSRFPPLTSPFPTPFIRSEVCRWLSKQAEAAGVDILPGYGGKEVLYDWDNRVVGVATGDVGIGKDGKKKEGFVPGVELMAKLTLLAEGCRGSLSEVRGGREGVWEGREGRGGRGGVGG